MLHRTRMACAFASVCLIILAMDAGVIKAANPTNTSSLTSENTELKKNPIERGMEVLYQMTNSFLGIVQKGHLYDQKWLNLTLLIQGNFDSSQITEDWREVADYGMGFSVCLVFGLLFAIFMPFVGCIFCCCRLAGKCGGKRKSKDPKRAKCKKISYCTVLLIINIFSLAGIVCAFVTSDLIHQKLENENNEGPLGTIDSALTKIRTYVNDTVNDLQQQALDKFDSARNDIITSINSSAATAVDRVLKLVNASTYLNQAKDLSNKVNEARNELITINTTLLDLKTNGDNLTEELKQLKEDINTTCASRASGCNKLDLNDYNTDADFSKLGDFSTEITKVSDSLNISEFVREAEGKVNDVKKNSTDVIRSNIDEASTAVNKIRTQMVTGINDYKSSIQNTMNPLTNFQTQLDNSQEDVKQYGNYIWYAGIAISCVFLLILVCYCLGVLFGLCGERPGRGAACCNTGAGGNFLMAGVAFSFMFSWILMIICIILFIPGGLVYTEVCRYFQTHDPNLLKPFEDQFTQGYDLSQKLYQKPNANISIVQILNNCKNNQAIYTAAYLENLISLDSVLNLTSVNTQIDDIASSNINFNNITILSPELKKQITDFGKAGIGNIDYVAYEEEINKNLTRVDLTELAGKLTNYANEIRNSNQAEANKFDGFAQRLRDIDNTVVSKMKADVKKMGDNLNRLKAKSNVENETTALVAGLETSQNTFNADGVTFVNDMIKDVVATVKTTVSNTVGGVKDYVKKDAGKCAPLFESLYLLTDSVCVVMLNPLNGFWFSMGWCLFFFIPSIIFAVKLSTLYHREEEYTEKEFDEPNFTMYAGPNPDRIPLTSMDQPHERGYGAHNTGYRDDGYNGKSRNGYATHAESPPAYDDNYNRGRQNGNRSGRPMNY
ncbi:prominin-1-A isoform X1 [Patella vulgata]|uniref:prominin-1-A isoform X1 n=1 Tax=Patella vulgata TaxID=6465 RepID=UPI0021800D78|nr:prominin-1-A isoform X1 [Patella vulgata]